MSIRTIDPHPDCFALNPFTARLADGNYRYVKFYCQAEGFITLEAERGYAFAEHILGVLIEKHRTTSMEVEVSR